LAHLKAHLEDLLPLGLGASLSPPATARKAIISLRTSWIAFDYSR